MLAATFRSPGGMDNLVIGEREVPTPGPGEVLIKVAHNSVNYRDYASAMGHIPVPDGRILMSDGAGEVVGRGPGASRFKDGEKVVNAFFPRWSGGPGNGDRRFGVPGDGIDGFGAEYAVYPETGLMRIPRGYTLAQAATLPCAAVTAWRSLMTLSTTGPGDIVLVQGSGGVSIFALQFAKAAGATVVATTSSNEKAERLRELGADHVINYREQPEWGAAVIEVTRGRGADTIVEVGGAGTLRQSIAAAAVNARICIIGLLSGTGAEFSTVDVVRRNLAIFGVSVGSHDDMRAMIRTIEAHGIKPVIDRHFPLAQLADAFAHQAANRHFGKIVIDVAAG